MSTVVYTVITGEYDRLRPPAVTEPGVRYVCFSDRPQSIGPWECQPFPQCFGRDARHNSRIPKMLPHLLLDCDVSIYHDGAFVLKAFPSSLVQNWLECWDMAAIKHPENVNYLQERDFYERIHGHVPEDVAKQVADFEGRGLPLGAGWCSGGFIIRRHNAVTAAFNEAWMREYLMGSTNDQFSFYSALCEAKPYLKIIDRKILDCPEAGYCLHADSGCQDNIEFEPERDQWRARVARIWNACCP